MELKGDFYINEIEYLAPATVYERGKPASEIIHNNVKDLAEHEQYCLIHCGTNQYLLRKNKRRLVREGKQEFILYSLNLIASKERNTFSKKS